MFGLPEKSTSPLRRHTWLRCNIAFNLSCAVLVALAVGAIAAPLVAPYDPNQMNYSALLVGPSADHWFGTDQLGRDLFSRMVYGTRTSLLGPIIILCISLILGPIIGVIAGWRGGWVDVVVSRATDTFYAFPGILFAVLVIAIIGKSFLAVVIALGIAFFPTKAKLCRSIAKAERAKPYIDAYRMQGLGGMTICVRALLPNIFPFVLGYSVVLFSDALMGMAALSFLGFGVQPPTSDWGLMVAQSRTALLQGALLPTLLPVAAIVVTVICFNVVGLRVADRLTGMAK